MQPRVAIRALVPEAAIVALRRRQAMLAMRRARRAFAAAPDGPSWLDAAELERLQTRFKPPRAYSYGPDATNLRGKERAVQLARIAPKGGAMLEAGAGDGMVSHHLARGGFEATALDLSPALFDERGRKSGVHFVTGDAAAMPLEEDSFDVVASYASFEHFPDPDAVLRELIRVAKPGGLIHVEFGPLYYSAYGLHAYQSVWVPYCQLLFEREVLEQHVAEHGLRPIPFESLNGWSVGRFRKLWAAHGDVLSPIDYRESPQIVGRDLIVEHPACFRAETDDFDDLLVALIRATFRVAAA